jgi:hypothetical protein
MYSFKYIIMKLLYKNLNINQLILFISANLLLVSCGTYQSAYNDDGIYADVSPKKEEQKVVVLNEREFDNYEQNYFTKKLEVLESIDDNEVFIDVDSYNSNDNYVDDEIIDEALNYDASQPWGYEDNNVIVHINLNNDPFMFGNNWNMGFNNGWGFNNWGIWGNPYWGNRFWGNNPYWQPFHNGEAWNGGFNNPYWNNRYWNNNRNRNYRYGRRTANNNNNNRYSRRNSSVNARNRTTTSRRNSTRPRRSSSTTARNSSTVRRSSNPARKSRTTARSNTPRRSSTSTRRSGNSSNSRNNSSSTRRSSSSNRNNSRSTSRSSSSRSSGSRSSRSKSSGSRKRSSSSKKRGN